MLSLVEKGDINRHIPHHQFLSTETYFDWSGGPRVTSLTVKFLQNMYICIWIYPLKKKLAWFTFTRGVYGCLRTCYALLIFKSRHSCLDCLKDQPKLSWFTSTRGVYLLFTICKYFTLLVSICLNIKKCLISALEE